MLAQAPRENARSRSWRTHYKNWLIDGVLHFTDALILAGSAEQLLCFPTMRLSLIKQGLQKAINMEEKPIRGFVFIRSTIVSKRNAEVCGLI